MADKMSTDIFRDQIIALFKKAGISQAELARRAKVSPNTVCHFLGKECSVSTAKATSMYRVLSSN